MKRATGDWD